MNDEIAALESKLLTLLLNVPLKVEIFSHPPSLDLFSRSYPSANFITLATREPVQQALWGLIARNLVYLQLAGHTPNLWQFVLTVRGRSAALDEEPNPDDPTGYLTRLLKSVPDTSDLVQMYLVEALNSYRQRCYLAAMVMLGVAAEASTLEAIAEFIKWANAKSVPIKKELANPRANYVEKLTEFHRQLTNTGLPLPKFLADTIGIGITGLLDLLRVTRNSVGHPTGAKVEAYDCYASLYSYSGIHKKLDALKKFFIKDTVP